MKYYKYLIKSYFKKAKVLNIQVYNMNGVMLGLTVKLIGTG